MTAFFTGKALSWEVVDDVLEVVLHREPANELGTTTLAELETLEGLLPVCAGCGAVRDDNHVVDEHGQHRWVPVERYLDEFDETLLTHETCPTCLDGYASGGLE